MTLLRVIAKCCITKHHLQLRHQKPAVVLQNMPPRRSLSNPLDAAFSLTSTQIIQPQPQPNRLRGYVSRGWAYLTQIVREKGALGGRPMMA